MEPSLALDDLPPLRTWQTERCLGVGSGGGGLGGGTARRLDVTEITREYEASVSLISRSL